MIIDMTKEEREQQMNVILAVGEEEILSQTCEECCELGQATNKVRRQLCGTLNSDVENVFDKLNEEVSDVLLMIDYLERAGFINLDAVMESAKRKNRRWYGRAIG